jgi:hypothetical protein
MLRSVTNTTVSVMWQESTAFCDIRLGRGIYIRKETLRYLRLVKVMTSVGVIRHNTN